MSEQHLTSDLFSEEKLPAHIAIVMDGNGRWAQRQGFERLKGHIQGVQALKRVVKGCLELDIAHLTLYAFSTENWGRPPQEISGLLKLLQKYLIENIDELKKNNIRLRFIGNYHVLEPSLVTLMEESIASSSSNTGLNLTIAFNYGGRSEIVRAVQKLAKRVRESLLTPEEITEEVFSQELYTYDLPDPDLFIRTSHEARLSNFLLWQVAYTEIVIVKTLWPDFTKKDLIEAIKEYQARDRRYGKIAS